MRRATLLLATLAWLATRLPTEAHIVVGPDRDPGAAASGGLAVPPTDRPRASQCWLDGRMILEDSDPFLTQFGLSGQLGTVILGDADGHRTIVTMVHHLPPACFPTARR